MNFTKRITSIAMASVTALSLCNTVGNCYIYKIVTIFKRRIHYTCNVIPDCYTCKSVATTKRILPNACYTIRNCNTCKAEVTSADTQKLIEYIVNAISTLDE